MAWGRSRSAAAMRCRLRCLLVAAALAPAGAGTGRAETLHYHYQFDVSRLVLEPDEAGVTIAVRDAAAGAWAVTHEAGRAGVPYQTLTFLVPRGSGIASVRTTDAQPFVWAAGLDLAAAAPWRDDLGRRAAALTAGTAAPGSGPTLAAVAAGGGAWCGWQLASVRVYPVRYDAVRREILVTPAMDLEIDLRPAGAPPLARRRFQPADDEPLGRALRSLVANPEAIASYDRPLGAWIDSRGRGFHPAAAPSLEGSPVEYLIVTSAALAPAWQTLADWKTARGVPAVVRTTEWIQANYRHGSDLQETIRTFLRDAYVNWGVRDVLLGGDTEVIPARYGFSAFGDPSEQSIPTDLYYACLDGNWNHDGDGVFGEAALDVLDPGDSTDVYAEVFVGRAPVSTAAEAAAFAAKVMTYENPPVTNYQQKYLMLGEVLSPTDWSPGQPVSLDGGAFSDQVLSWTGACLDTVRLYENTGAFPGSAPLTRSRVLEALNAGPGFVDHIGHGFRYNMSCGDASLVNSDILALTNGDRRFILYMLNCSAAAFDYPCLAEAFLKAPGGAVAVLGASRAAFAIPSRNYNREFFKAVHQDHFAHVGEAFVQSRLPYTPDTYFDGADHYTHFIYNYLGDPEIVAHTCSLATTTASYPGAVPLGSTSVAVHVEAGGLAQPGALVCIGKGAAFAEAYAWGMTDAGGDVTLPFQPATEGPAQITVSGQNLTLHQGTLWVGPAPGAFVHLDAAALHEDASPPAAGNGDGVLDAGETVAVDIAARNEGPLPAANVQGVLRIASSWAALTDSVFGLGGIAGAGGSAVAPRDAVFTVAPATPDGTVLPLEFVFSDGTSAWTNRAARVVHAPAVRLVRLAVFDPAPGGNGDGSVQAGETVELAPVFKNYGSGAAPASSATLASSDPDVSILADSIPVAALAAHQELTAAAHFRLTEATLEENPLTLVLRDGYGRETQWSLTLRPPGKAAKPALSTKSGANIINITWTPSPDPDLAGYQVYRSGSGLGPWTRITIDRTLRTAYYSDAGLAPNAQYFYRVTALDESGNEGPPSDPASINTSPAQLAGWPLQLVAASSCPVAVGDVTGDGAQEIVAGSSRLYAWHWDAGELRDGDDDAQTWGVLTKSVGTLTGAIALADLDGLPGEEIFAAAWDDSNKVFAVRGDGSLLPGWPQNPAPLTSTRGYWGSTAAVDVDADGTAELFAPGRNGTLYAWRADGSPLGATAAFKTGFGANIRSSPAFANLDADPQLEIVFASPAGQLNVWNTDGSSLPGFPVSAGGAVLSNPAVGDVNGDGVLDIVLETEGGGGFVHVYNSATASELPGWPRTLTIKGNPVSPSPALADFDGDGKLEIVVANVGGSAPTLSRVQVFDWQGNIVSGWPRTVGNANSESSPVVADLDGDGVSDVLFGNESGFLYGWNWHGGTLPGFPITIGDFVRSTPYVDDVDGDGDVDVVLSGWDKNVYVWDFPAPWHPSAAQWPTLKHDVHRSGTYGFVFDIAPPTLPAVLESPSHTVITWSNDRTVDVQWNPATDASGIGGYSYAWNTDASATPDSIVDGGSAQTTSPPLPDGTAHWFHLRAVDTRGHWTRHAVHLGPFWIDGTAPANSSGAAADRASSVWSNQRTITMTWNPVTEDVNGGGGPGRLLRSRPVLAPYEPTAPPAGAARSPSPAGRGNPMPSPLPVGPQPAVPGLPRLSAASHILGYSIVWDESAATVPDAVVETAGVTATSPLLADGSTHWFHLRTVDAAGNGSPPQATLHVGPFWVDATAPTVTVVAPNGGEFWAALSAQQIRWRAEDAGSGVQTVTLLLSMNGGTTFPDTIATVPGADSTYLWTVPGNLAGMARVRAVATDWVGATAEDDSDGDFGGGPNLAPQAPPVTRTWLETPGPNPFNPVTVLRYSLLETGAVHLAVYDARGHRVRTLVDGVQPGPQWYRVSWDGHTAAGTPAASGTYYVRFRAPHFGATRTVVLLK